MNSEELTEWVTYHKATFQSWKRFLDDQSEAESAVTIDRIRGMIGNLSLEAAKAATDALLMMETTPRAERHIVEVWRIARGLDAKAVEKKQYAKFGENTFACPYCRDSGKVGFFVGSAPSLMMADPETGSPIRFVDYAWRAWGGRQGLRRIVRTDCFCPASRGEIRPARAVWDDAVLVIGKVWFQSTDGSERSEGFGERVWRDLSRAEKASVDQCADQLEIEHSPDRLRVHRPEEEDPISRKLSKGFGVPFDIRTDVDGEEGETK